MVGFANGILYRGSGLSFLRGSKLGQFRKLGAVPNRGFLRGAFKRSRNNEHTLLNKKIRWEKGEIGRFIVDYFAWSTLGSLAYFIKIRAAELEELKAAKHVLSIEAAKTGFPQQQQQNGFNINPDPTVDSILEMQLDQFTHPPAKRDYKGVRF